MCGRKFNEWSLAGINSLWESRDGHTFVRSPEEFKIEICRQAQELYGLRLLHTAWEEVAELGFSAFQKNTLRDGACLHSYSFQGPSACNICSPNILFEILDLQKKVGQRQLHLMSCR